jgi:hypothetical protein
VEKILLAIDGITPNKKIFRYAVQLCQQIRAGLNILQIIRPEIKKVRKKADNARKYFEGFMVVATFAEAGEHETAKAMMTQEMMAEAFKNINRLLPESEKAGIPYQLTMRAGNPCKEIKNYIKEHRDVVLAIYDSNGEGHDARGVVKKKNTVPKKIKRALSIPVVTIRC